jgi:hypothetical protein
VTTGGCMTYYTYKDKSVIDFFQYAYSDFVRMRPIEVIYKVGSYWLFGFRAFGYHLSNIVILIVCNDFTLSIS